MAAAIRGLLGTDWTDPHGVARPLSVHDAIEVTPYNNLRDLVTHAVEVDPETAGIEVGTVDKFQGRQAAIVSSP